MLRSADYIYDNVVIADEKNTTKQFCKKAQVGVDFSVARVYKIITPGIIRKSHSKVSQYEEIKPSRIDELFPEEEFIGWFLPKGTYLIEPNEGVQLGPNDTGYFIQRSSFNRSGASVISSVFDPGYTTASKDGIGTFTLRMNVDNENGVYFEKNTRVAQMLVFENEDTELYDGQFQNGRTTSKLLEK